MYCKRTSLTAFTFAICTHAYKLQIYTSSSTKHTCYSCSINFRISWLTYSYCFDARTYWPDWHRHSCTWKGCPNRMHPSLRPNFAAKMYQIVGGNVPNCKAAMYQTVRRQFTKLYDGNVPNCTAAIGVGGVVAPWQNTLEKVESPKLPRGIALLLFVG